jgi:hypothetical protein
MKPEAMAYSVAIVVERDFGDELVELAKRLHVWVCYTPANQRQVERVGGALPANPSVEHGVTTFDFSEADSPEEVLMGVLGAVDLHHGEYSHSPPWSTLEVYGASPTTAVRAVLGEFGVDSFSSTERGFLCSRPEEGAA